MSKLLMTSRASIIYLERSRVHVDGDRVVYAVAEGSKTRFWSIPYANTSVILLGHGCSITSAAARKLADEKVMLAFTGTGGTPLLMGSINEYAPPRPLQLWMTIWLNEEKRLEVAKEFSRVRIQMIEEMWPKIEFPCDPCAECHSFREGIAKSGTIEALRGYEGSFTKALYAAASRSVGLPWSGRITRSQDEQDLANHFLDQGNYLAYGLAGAALWTLGIPPGLPVSHGATRAGGLVFDVADMIKDATVLPVAFLSAQRGSRTQDYRDILVDIFDEHRILKRIFNTIYRILGL